MTDIDVAGTHELRAKVRLADIVYEQLLRLIERGEFPRGLKLPAENALAQRFGVSRPVVRDALARLRDANVVRSQKGSGTVVVLGPRAGLPSLPAIRTVADLVRFYEFRIGVEGATAALAAERRTAADLRDIEAALNRAGDLLADGLHPLLADANFAFHRAIARATQNPYYASILEGLPNFVGRIVLDSRAATDLPSAEYSTRIQAEHQAIFAAILNGDAQRARIEMERHILSARDTILEGQAVRPRRAVADRTSN